MSERGRRKRGQFTRHDRRQVEGRGSPGRFLHCGQKRRYKSQARADEQRKRAERGLGLQFDSYLCRYCDHWHIGRAKYYENGLTHFKKVEKQL